MVELWVLLLATPKPITHRHGIRIASAGLLGTKYLQPEYVLPSYLSTVRASRAENSSADLDVDVMVFM